MRKRSLLFLSLLVPAFLGLGGHAVLKAQQKTSTASAKRWSDPAAWPDKKVPTKDAVVTIDKDMNVVLDVTPPALRSLTINGKLSFADNKDLELTTEWVMVHGELEIGSEARPHTRKATITLTDNVKDEDMSGVGGTTDRSDRGIMMMGGTLNLHGNRTNSWTKLSKTAEAGSNSIEVLNAAGWRAGDAIVLASTDFDPHQAERRTIAAIRGNTITLDKKLDYMHFGKVTFDVDERGEVGMLSRNIVVQASPDADKTLFGGHIMAMVGSKMFVDVVELNRMGQNMHLARYPIHWHLIGDGGQVHARLLPVGHAVGPIEQLHRPGVISVGRIFREGVVEARVDQEVAEAGMVYPVNQYGEVARRMVAVGLPGACRVEVQARVHVDDAGLKGR